MVLKNINKTNKIRKLEKKLKREHRRLSRKYESLKSVKERKEKIQIIKKLYLWGWYSSEFVTDWLIPEIEKNCEQYGVLSQAAYEIFQKNKFAENSIYFHHGYAESDIPIGQEYEALSFIEDYYQPEVFIQNCHARILCFFNAFHTRPTESAMRGHHELSLIQFEQGVPQIICNELHEITKESPLNSTGKRFCLSTRV